MTAVITEHRAGEVCHGLWIKLEKIPVARLAHGGFAAKFVQFEDKTRFFLFRHNTLLFAVYGTCAAVATSPCCQRVLPDSISANLSPDAWSPTPTVPSSARTCFFP